jgi:hypothetical protein
MNSFKYKNRNLLSGPHFIGSLFIIAGLFALTSPVFFNIETSIERVIGVGVGALIFGLFLTTTYSGTIIDFSKKRYKQYWTIAGYKTGEWTTLPTIIKVKVISSSRIETNNPNGISPTLSGKVTDFKVLLCSNSSKPSLSFVYSKKEKSMKDAKILASHLNAELILAISKEA